MVKKKNVRFNKQTDDLNIISQLMLKQNDSLRKLLEELSRNDKSNHYKGTYPYQFINSKSRK